MKRFEKYNEIFKKYKDLETQVDEMLHILLGDTKPENLSKVDIDGLKESIRRFLNEDIY